MKEIAKKVKTLKPFDVDKVTIKKDHYFRNAYIIDLPLDSIPDHVWQDIFEQKWKSSRHLWDRKLFVIGDNLRLVTTADEFGDKLDWVERVIKETNKGIDKHNLMVRKEEEIRTKEEMEKQKIREEKSKMEMMRDTLRKRCI